MSIQEIQKILLEIKEPKDFTENVYLNFDESFYFEKFSVTYNFDNGFTFCAETRHNGGFSALYIKGFKRFNSGIKHFLNYFSKFIY